MAIVYHARGEGGNSDQALRELTERFSVDGAYQIAGAHAARGEMNAAFAWLGRAYDQNDGGLMYLLGDPVFEAARGDPRWNGVLAKLGLGA
jgi:hypothetical protein